MTDLLDRLDHLLAVRQQLERENVPAQRMSMSCGDLETLSGAVPVLVQTPFPGMVQVRADTECATFVRFGVETPWPESHRCLLESLQTRIDAPIVYLAEAFVRIVRHRDECVVTVGTLGKPGWSNQNPFSLTAFDYLASMAGIGGFLIHFADPFERPFEAPQPETEQPLTWADIRRPGVGERALTLIKRPRERLILLLAVHLRMSPAEINSLNLFQVTQKLGRDVRLRVYLKKRLVRKKAVAEALLQYRQRERESYWDSKEPMFRTGKTTRSGRSRRMGAKAIEAAIERYAQRALKGMPVVATVQEPSVPPVRPPMLWVSDIEYHRN